MGGGEEDEEKRKKVLQLRREKRRLRGRQEWRWERWAEMKEKAAKGTNGAGDGSKPSSLLTSFS